MKEDFKPSRREFLKKGIHSAALATMVPAGLKARGLFNPGSIKQDNFVYRTLGNTGIKLPIISMGAGDTNNVDLMKKALDSGIKLLATSQYYGNGNNEIVVGEAIKGRDRDSVVVATSAMPDGVDHKAGLFTEESKTETHLEKLDGSLKRMNVDYVDIFLLPFAAKRESVFFEPLLRAMEKAKEQGKAKFVGIATHKYEDEAILAAIDSKIYDVIMTSYNIKEKKRDAIADAIEEASKAGLGIIGMKTMAGRYWDKEKTQPLNTKASLKWVLQNEHIHTTVPGITTYEQLEEDIAIMGDFELTEEEKQDLKLVQVESKNGLYCQQCGICIGQCKESLDIPTIMRSYMYAYGYKNLSHAKETLSSASISHFPCIDCETCEVNCAMGFDVKGKIMDIARLDGVPDDFLV